MVLRVRPIFMAPQRQRKWSKHSSSRHSLQRTHKEPRLTLKGGLQHQQIPDFVKTGNSLTSQFSARIGGAPCTSEQDYQESGCDLGIQCSVRCGGLGYRQHRQKEGGELLKSSVHKDHRSRAPGTEGRMMLSSREMCPCQGRLVRMVAEWVKI